MSRFLKILRRCESSHLHILKVLDGVKGAKCGLFGRQCDLLALCFRWLLVGACTAAHNSLGTKSPRHSTKLQSFQAIKLPDKLQDMWHVKCGREWRSYINFSSLAHTIWEWWCFEDWEENRRHWYNVLFWHFVLHFLHVLAPFFCPFDILLHLFALVFHFLKIYDFLYFS